MTPRQRDLARHALGLPNRNRRSYRNRFLTGGACPDWRAMEAAGLARSQPTDKLGRAWFHLTRAGAEAALERGERLCREDFPPPPRPRDARGRYVSEAAEGIAA
ncbi:hypothetical protein [Methylobacterium sp. CCH5-D2]|uniref:hypothetical protein n=1 Tax=Methylobacterium sp. CCH5-D2 TaxID=1768765 RepID=UPI000AF9B957|nr:hypothetical protein [Methylobacterium sp. CCH5-D2]